MWGTTKQQGRVLLGQRKLLPTLSEKYHRVILIAEGTSTQNSSGREGQELGVHEPFRDENSQCPRPSLCVFSSFPPGI